MHYLSRVPPHGGCAPWQSRPVSALAAHITGNYHEYISAELPWLARQAAELAAVFGDARAPHLGALPSVLSELRDAVSTHAWTEEDLLFPVLLAREYPAVLTTALTPDALLRLIDSLVDDHARIGGLLASITTLLREASLQGAEVPSWALLFERVEQLRDRLLEQLDLEDRCLLPRARALAQTDWPVRFAR